MLIEVAGTIDDRGRGLVLDRDTERHPDNLVVLGMNELEQRMPYQRIGCEPKCALRDGRRISDDSAPRVLGDEIGRIFGDELEAAHRLDQRILAFAKTAGQPVEGAGERGDLA